MTGQVTLSEYIEIFEKLSHIEKRVWETYFPSESKTFGSVLLAANNSLTKQLRITLPEAGGANKKVVAISDVDFKKLLDKFYSAIPKKVLNNIKDNPNGWIKFLPDFLNVYVLEITKDESLSPFEKIVALKYLHDSFDKIALLGNVNLYAPFQVSFAFLEKEIKNRIQLMQEKWNTLMQKIEENAGIEQGDMHFWPGTTEQLDRFYNLLLKYRLILPNANYRSSFLEKLEKENQLVLIDRRARNKMLIYLLYLLYGNKKEFKGYFIHNIAAHVFYTSEGPLDPSNLNTQFGRLYSKDRKTILNASLDDNLIMIQSLINEFNSPVATLRLSATN